MVTDTLPAAIVDALLDKLASDDAFRDAFARDPGAALAALGYRAREGTQSPAMCLNVGTLASKEQIARSRDALRAAMTSVLPKGGFGLEAN